MERIYRVRIGQNNAGCNETQAKLRDRGQERVLFSWFQCQSHVLAYIPVFGFFNRPTSIWEFELGPLHPVLYGQADIAPKAVISAIYGAASVYREDTSTQPGSPTVSPEELTERAAALARHSNASPRGVAALLADAQRAGLVDARSLESAASLVGRDRDWIAIEGYLNNLTAAQTALLLERVMERLETPGICDYCLGTRQRGLIEPWGKIKARLSEPEIFAVRAKRLFEQRSDLAIWQYEEALRLIVALGPSDRNLDLRRQTLVFPMLAADESSAFSEKAIAYLRNIHQRPSSAQQLAMSTKFNLVSDQYLKEFIVGFWDVSLTHLRARNSPPETVRQAASACKRIAQISDPNLRAQFVVMPKSDQSGRVDCSTPRESERQ